MKNSIPNPHKPALSNDPTPLAIKDEVRQMFDNIAPRYDFLNHFLSLGIDKIWRRKVFKIMKRHPHQQILDIASGTGDMAILASKLKPEAIFAIDISKEMLNEQQKKLKAKNLENLIKLKVADGEDIPFEANSFDIITTAFGVRNFENLDLGLREMHRVLKNGGITIILEFSKPTKTPVKQLYQFYFKNILPFLGSKISKNSNAYTYLPESVSHFPSGDGFTEHLKKAGFRNTTSRPLTFGIASIYTGQK